MFDSIIILCNHNLTCGLLWTEMLLFSALLYLELIGDRTQVVWDLEQIANFRGASFLHLYIEDRIFVVELLHKLNS